MRQCLKANSNDRAANTFSCDCDDFFGWSTSDRQDGAIGLWLERCSGTRFYFFHMQRFPDSGRLFIRMLLQPLRQLVGQFCGTIGVDRLLSRLQLAVKFQLSLSIFIRSKVELCF